MTLRELLVTNQHEMLRDARRMLCYAVHKSMKLCRDENNPLEPDIVASLSRFGIPRLAKSWGKHFIAAGIDYAMASVFVHQSPIISFPDMPNKHCEIGDILIAHIHHPLEGECIRNALLLQAKISASEKVLRFTDSQDVLQYTVYHAWPKFKYRDKGVMNCDDTLQVTPSKPHRGAQYLLISRDYLDEMKQVFDHLDATNDEFCHSDIWYHPWFPCPFQVSLANQPLYPHSNFENELLGLLVGSTGRSFGSRALLEYTHNWSRVIWDLLKITANRKFKQSKISQYPKRENRGGVSGDGSLFENVIENNYQSNWSQQSSEQPVERISLISTHNYCPNEISSILSPVWDELYVDQTEAADIGSREANTGNLPPNDGNFPRESDDWNGEGISLVLIETSDRGSAKR